MKTVAGASSLIRLIGRRDRVLLPLWVLIMGFLPMATVSGFQGLYTTDAQVAQATASFGNNPAFLTMFGPVYGSSIGALSAWRSGLVPVIVGLISMMTVIRHTRVEEEAGRRELLGATVLGRHAGLAAVLAVLVVANVVLAGLTTVLMMAVGQPLTGSLAFGLAVAAAGLLFAGVGAVAAQLSESAGTARGIGLVVLGLAYVLRAAGDAGGEGSAFGWLVWLSPFGWLTRVRPFADERWWLLLVPVVVGSLLAVVAYVLESSRDLDSGLLKTRLGPATAGAGLSSPLGLAWRLHRGLLYGWAVGFAVLGLIYGSVAESVGDLFEDNPQLGDILERLAGGGSVLIDLYIAAVMGLLGLIAAAYGIQATLRLRTEEEALRANAVLATSVGRGEWLASHLVFGLLGPSVALVVAGTVAGLTYGANVGDVGGQLPRVLGAALIQLPAVWVLVSLTFVLFGLRPEVSRLSWGLYGAIVILGLLGAVLGLSQWVLDLSPFTHVPALPGVELTYPPVAALLAVGAALLIPGFAGFARRDTA